MKKITPNPLYILKGFSALFVIMYHMQYPGVILPVFVNKSLSFLTFSNGLSFVWVFFILSGYLIGKGFVTKRYKTTPLGLLSYIGKRFVSIALFYYPVLFINMYVSRTYYGDKFWFLLGRALTFNANEYITKPGIDYLWTISMEMQWYLIAPMVFAISYLILRNIPKKIVYPILLLVITSGFMIRYITFTKFFPDEFYKYLGSFYIRYFYNWDFFVFGFLINYLPDINIQIKINSILEKIKNLVMLPVSLLLISVMYTISSYIRYYNLADQIKYIYYQAVILPLIITLLTGIYIIIFDKSDFRSFNRNIATLTLTSVGFFSYQIYLVHLPLMNFLGLHCLKTGNGCLFSDYLVRLTTLVIISVTVGILYKLIIGKVQKIRFLKR